MSEFYPGLVCQVAETQSLTSWVECEIKAPCDGPYSGADWWVFIPGRQSTHEMNWWYTWEKYLRRYPDKKDDLVDFNELMDNLSSPVEIKEAEHV